MRVRVAIVLVALSGSFVLGVDLAPASVGAPPGVRPRITTVAATATLPRTAATTPTSAQPTGVGGDWSLIFDDEFNSTALDTAVWSPSWFGGETMNSVVTAASNVAEANGDLSLKLSSPSSGALVDTNPQDTARPGFTFTYGFVEARIWFPGSGSTIDDWPAFWTDGQNWPATGEIDIAEGLKSMSANYHNAEGEWRSPKPDTPVATGGSWHVYGVDWQAGSITWYVDGKVVYALTAATTAITASPQYLILNLGAGQGPTAVGAPMKVDYVRVWQPTSGPNLISSSAVLAGPVAPSRKAVVRESAWTPLLPASAAVVGGIAFWLRNRRRGRRSSGGLSR